MVNHVITRNGKLLKLLVLLILWEQKLSLGKLWKKVSNLRIGQNNLENLLPHIVENSLKSRGLSWWLWLSKILGQAKAVVGPGLAWPTA
jgi:hypothetical protein